MPKVLLPVSLIRQRSDGDCLAACAAMVLSFVGRPVEYSQLLALLKINNFGAPAGNVRNLAQLGLSVNYTVTDLDGLVHQVQDGTPAMYSCVQAICRIGNI